MQKNTIEFTAVFTYNNSNKMIIISSQKTTILDCDNGKIENCMIDYDEEELIAICDKLPDEQILIAGEYGGNLPDTTNKGERVLIQKTKEYITTITFIPGQSDEIKVYENYGAYICGFSYDGKYFVIANAGGIIVIKRCC